MTAPDLCCANETCYRCRFWHEKIAMREAGDVYRQRPSDEAIPVARVNGWHYMLGPIDTKSEPRLLGLGGRLLTFRFSDGREITSNDVMCQGEIPARFRDRLPNNAIIIRESPAYTSSVTFGETEGRDA